MKKILLLLLFFSIVFVGRSQDPIEEIDGQFFAKSLAPGIVYCALPVDNDKYLVAGNFTNANGYSIVGIAMYGLDGYIDFNFAHSSGSKALDGAIRNLALYPNNKVVAVGSFTAFNEIETPAIVLLNLDGTLDNTFTSSLDESTDIFSVAVQSTGKIIISGVTGGAPFITRLNSDGTRDNTFVAPALPDDGKIKVLIALPDDKILAGGYFRSLNSVASANHLVRLNSNGSFDDTFNAQIPSTEHPLEHIFRLADGTFYSGSSIVRKHKADGSADNTFAPNTTIQNPVMMAMCTDESVIAGTTQGITQYSKVGEILSTLAPGGVNSQEILADNTLFYVGKVGPFDWNQFLFGIHDKTIGEVTHNSLFVTQSGFFLPNNVLESTILDERVDPNSIDILQQPDGKFVIRTPNPYFRSNRLGDSPQRVDHIFRTDPTDLSVDVTFKYTSPWTNNDQKLLYVTDDGGILMRQYNNDHWQLAKVLKDGGVDTDFIPMSGYFVDVDKTPDGYVGIRSYSAMSEIVKFDATGTVDNSIDANCDCMMKSIHVASDGKWYISRDTSGVDFYFFSHSSATTVKQLFRLTANGDVDNTFNDSQNIQFIHKTGITNNNEIMSAGRFTIDATSNDSFPLQRWTASGASDIIHDAILNRQVGLDFIVTGNYIYLTTASDYYSAPVDYMIYRLKLTGLVDTHFKPLKYRREAKNPVSQSPDRLIMLADKSLLIVADKFYHIIIPAPPKAPSNLTALTTGDGKVNLSWKDNSVDETGFEIERSENGDEFISIHNVEANATSYTDNSLVDGRSYGYRIRSVNTGGESAYSNVSNVDVVTGIMDVEEEWEIYPNPVKSQLHIRSNEIVERFVLFQMDGRMVESTSPRSNDFNIDMSNYSAGLYLLKIEHSSSKKTFKVVKQ